MSIPLVLALVQDPLRADLARLLVQDKSTLLEVRFLYDLYALAAQIRQSPNGLLLGYEEGGADVFVTLEAVCRLPATPPIMLITSSVNPEFRRRCFHLGISEILLAPFEPADLMWRLARLVNVSKSLSLGAWYLDARTNTLLHKETGESQKITGAESRALHCLLLAQGLVVDRNELGRVISPDKEGNGTVSTIISRLRRKVGSLPGAHCAITPIRNRGYQLDLTAAPCRPN